MAGTSEAIYEKFAGLASNDLTEFRQFFRRLRKLFPEQAAEASLWYMANHGLDTATKSMAFWFSGDTIYVAVLLDPDTLPTEVAAKAVAVAKEVDAQFLIKFAKATQDLKSPVQIHRALSLLPAVGDYSICIPWLRHLSQSSDVRVRSHAAKLLCELRPSKGLIERQMQSSDARVRATAVEALEHSTDIETARAIFQSALKDMHHRVVGNALVGLYHLGETEALNEMIELCGHKDHLFRAAMAWAMGAVKDVRAIPTLQELTKDPSLVVRKRALSSLLILESLGESEKPEEMQRVSEVPPDEAIPDATEQGETSFNLFLFK